MPPENNMPNCPKKHPATGLKSNKTTISPSHKR